MLDRNSHRRGSALIMVMGVLVLLSIVGTAFVLLMRIEARAARNFVEDAKVQLLARGALSYAIEHPSWNPPTTITEADGTDWDGLTQTYSAWFKTPLSDVPSDYNAYFAIRKTVFGDRVNVNWNGFYKANPANTDGTQTLNEGYSPTEVSLERAITAYLVHLIVDVGYFPGAQAADAGRVAHEIAGRICNYRYGQSMGTPPTPPYAYFHGLAPGAFSEGPGVLHFPGEDDVEDTRFVDDANYAFQTNPPVPPLARCLSDIWTKFSKNTWIGANLLPLGTSVSINWRSDPQRNWVDDDGDGLYDETAALDNDIAFGFGKDEPVDEPQEFLQGSRLWNGVAPLPAPWANNQDDTPFGSDDMAAIISNPAAVTPLTEIVNDVFRVWTIPQGILGYGDPAVNYFDLLRPIFTTGNWDDVGDLLPLNHQNLLYPPLLNPPVMTADEKDQRDAVDAERSKFIAAMWSVLKDGGMADSALYDYAATNTAWQIMANLIDYLDDDADKDGNRFWDPGPNTAPRDIITVVDKNEGWKANDPAFDNDPANGVWDPGEPGLRRFHGTERQPYLNEFWVYNRSSDRFDNDNNGKSDADAPPDVDEIDSGEPLDGYYIELTNQYATKTTLYAPGSGMNWCVRILDGTTGVEKGRYDLSTARVWIAGGTNDWGAPGAAPVVIRGGKQLIIQSFDYAEHDKAGTFPASYKLPHYSSAAKYGAPGSNVPADADLIDLNFTDRKKVMFGPADKIELVYAYNGGTSTDEVVLDRQQLPDSMAAATVGASYAFWPSWERQDPRLSLCMRAPGTPRLLESTYSQNGSLQNGDFIRNTLGIVNDNGDGDADGSVFDGNYDLGKDSTVRYDDLVDIPNVPTWKFGNVAALGNLLCAGPMPEKPSDYGWANANTWLVKHSPYTAVPDVAVVRPLDAKKINFIDPSSVTDFEDPQGRAGRIFDKFMVWCPWRNGRDDNGNWTMADDIPAPGFDGPVPGQAHLDEDAETYFPGLVSINAADTTEANAVMSALPFVVQDDNAASTTFDPLGIPAANFYIPVDPTGAAGIRGALQTGPFASRADFFVRVVMPIVSDPLKNFGKDQRDNEIYESDVINPGTFKPIRVDQPVMWGTIQRPPRTAASLLPTPPTAPIFSLPGQENDGGDLLVDEKSEIDYTVGALMNSISLRGPYTQYRVTVQIRNRAGDAVRGEKRLIALVNFTVPANDPKRIVFVNWAIQ